MKAKGKKSVASVTPHLQHIRDIIEMAYEHIYDDCLDIPARFFAATNYLTEVVGKDMAASHDYDAIPDRIKCPECLKVLESAEEVMAELEALKDLVLQFQCEVEDVTADLVSKTKKAHTKIK